MRNAKVWLAGAFLASALIGAVVLLSTSSGRAAAERERERAVAANRHWEHHDGHWSVWSEGDNAWYYTDGSHWYFNDGGNDTAWELYRFDGEHSSAPDFERGDYKVPEKALRLKCLATTSAAVGNAPRINTGFGIVCFRSPFALMVLRPRLLLRCLQRDRYPERWQGKLFSLDLGNLIGSA